jgi:hypothetical protein
MAATKLTTRNGKETLFDALWLHGIWLKDTAPLIFDI